MSFSDPEFAAKYEKYLEKQSRVSDWVSQTNSSCSTTMTQATGSHKKSRRPSRASEGSSSLSLVDDAGQCIALSRRLGFLVSLRLDFSSINPHLGILCTTDYLRDGIGPTGMPILFNVPAYES
ncbi:hypothetical protein CVT24_007782 [Panaeolus cyanescens]|uniref:Uncharacterized protein n=1 Tax=Panaeolus cyanescens TaxID=181874 RepID=A0A409YKV9_9AGAR|nr:hypothetical protein CVT24_007782 [Panaeolus cyanescens]